MNPVTPTSAQGDAKADEFDARRYFDGGVAERYDQGIRLSCPSYDALHQMLFPVLRLLPPGARFLSVGAGTGAEILCLAPRFPGWSFAGVDVSTDMLEVCRQRLAQAGLSHRVVLHAGRLGDFSPEQPFDGASSIFVAHFIKGREEKLAYLRAIAAKLKPGATLVLADLFGKKGSPEFVRLMQAWLLYYTSHGVIAEKLARDLQLILQDIAFVPEDELFALLNEAGFANPVRFYQTFLFGGWIATRRE